MPFVDFPSRLRPTVEEIDRLLAGLANFGDFQGLLTDDDPQVQGLVERTVISVRAARALTADLLAEIAAADSAATALADTASMVAAGSPEPVVAPAPVPIVRPPEHLEQITMANPTGMRELILIADHNQADLAEMERMLTDEDYRVLSVRDGFETISIYARLWAAIDLVILDFSLPGMAGDLVFDELQAINPKVAAVVSSGFTHPDKLKQMLGQGLSGFLPKPYERERLIRQITQVLAHRPEISR